MKNFVLKVKYQLFDLYQEYKYENLIYKKYKQPTPKWENIVAITFIIANLLYMMFTVYDEVLVKEYYRFICGVMGILSLLLAVAFGLQAKREFKSLTKYYKERKLNKNVLMFSQKRFIFTSILFTKVIKPTLQVCFHCGGALIGSNFLFESAYGFSPIGEIERARHGTQTWEQAGHHLFNPYEYENSPEKPYIQDIKNELLRKENELLRKDNKIKELENLLDTNSKK